MLGKRCDLMPMRYEGKRELEYKQKRELFDTIRKNGVGIRNSDNHENRVWQVGSKKIYVKFAKRQQQSSTEDKYFFDVLEGFFNFQDYILFVCGTSETMILLPTLEFARLSNGVPRQKNKIKLDIFVTYGKFELYLSGKGRNNVTDYLKDTAELINTLKTW